jgi:hypothetical protein
MKSKNVIHSVRSRIVDLGEEPLFVLELEIEELESRTAAGLSAKSAAEGAVALIGFATICSFLSA